MQQTESGVFGVLNPALVSRTVVDLGQTVDPGTGFSITPFAVPGKVPLYMETADIERDIGAETETTIGLEIVWDGKRLYYIPGCAKITPALKARVHGAAALFFDGTTYTDDEMVRLGLSRKTAWRMGHVAMSGDAGSMALLADCAISKRVYIHINNTNPVLREDAPERAAVARAGWEVGHDGMEIVL